MPVKTDALSPEAQEFKRKMFDAFQSLTVPPHEGELDYERLCNRMTDAEWRAHAERALATLRSRKSYQGGVA